MSLGLVLGALILPYILAGEIYEYTDTMDGVRLPEVDAIVVLAGGRGRIAAAGDLWYRYWEAYRRAVEEREPAVPKVPILYVSGMGPQANWTVLRRQLRAGVRDVIPPEHVVIERESFNTEANARWLGRYIARQGAGSPESRLLFNLPDAGAGPGAASAKFLPVLAKPVFPVAPPRWKRIVLVTSPYHMRRATLIFQKIFQSAGLDVQIQTLSAFQEPFEAGEWRSSVHGTHVTLLEYFKWVFYRLLWKPVDL